MDDLPADVISNIMNHLPIDSAMRLRRTCTKWHYAIENTSWRLFIKFVEDLCFKYRQCRICELIYDEAASEGRLDIIKCIEELHRDYTASFIHGCAVAAACNGHLEVVQYLDNSKPKSTYHLYFNSRVFDNFNTQILKHPNILRYFWGIVSDISDDYIWNTKSWINLATKQYEQYYAEILCQFDEVHIVDTYCQGYGLLLTTDSQCELFHYVVWTKRINIGTFYVKFWSTTEEPNCFIPDICQHLQNIHEAGRLDLLRENWKICCHINSIQNYLIEHYPELLLILNNLRC